MEATSGCWVYICTVKTLHTCGIYFGGVHDMLASDIVLYKIGDMFDMLTSDIAHMHVGYSPFFGGAKARYIFWGHNNVCY